MREERSNPASGVWLSVVAPAHDEEPNIAALVEEVHRAMLSEAGARALSGRGWEFVVVDDGSTDQTRARLLALREDGRPWLRIVAMSRTPKGKGAGQSAAFWAGFRAARGEVLATLDADLQNDPADIPRLAALLESSGAALVQGDRSHARRDNIVRRWGSVVGRAFRRMILGDTVRDTGCSLRAIRRDAALLVPLEFRGVHRFIPATVAALGLSVVETRVAHRPRTAGETKYGMGIAQRAIPGLLDCFAMRWMFARRRWTDHRELGAEDAGRPAPGAPPAHAVVTRAPGDGAHAGATR